MLRQDRNLVERLFSQGLVKVLVCTATLAWGINLPAHAVIIKVSGGDKLDGPKRVLWSHFQTYIILSQH